MSQSQLQIKRAAVTIATVDIDENTIYEGEFMGMDKISASFTTKSIVPIQLDDYIEYLGNKYTIKSAIGLEQVDNDNFNYEVTFFGEIYAMYDVLIMHLGRTNFSYTGTPLELLSLIVDRMNSEQPGWGIGDCSLISEPETFTFDGQSCRTALTTVAEAFKLEYKAIGKSIYLIEKVGKINNITLRYGRGKGLFKASRQAIDQSFATVWYGYGGSQNLPEGYRGGMDRISLSAPIERNVALYGRKQGTVTFEDVFPQRTSAITAINGLNEVTDITLDFDINAQQITDGGAKIVFKSGELSGKEFVITGYNNSSKSIKFGSNKDDTGYTTPNATFSAAIGDKYTLIGIVMPNSYVIAAEAEVLARLNKHADQNSFPPVAFPLDIDEKYIREMKLTNKLIQGDSVSVVSESLGVDAYLRLQSVSWPLINPSLITGVVSDHIQYSTQERIAKDVKKNKKESANAISIALNTRQVADEIANAAIMDQFKRTYVGERAILTGAFVAGNPEAGEVAGINGTDNNPESVRFWAGSSFEDKENASFRVLQNGQMYATDAIIEGVIKALSGQIGFLDVNSSSLSLGAVPGSSDPWAAFTSAIRFYTDSFLYRLNGANRGDIRELAYNIYSNNLGSQYTESVRITNNVENIGAGTRNTGLRIDADKAGENIALDIANGDIMVDGNVGVNYEADIRIGGDSFVRMKWVKGILVSVT